MVKHLVCYMFLSLVYYCEGALQILEPPVENGIDECVSNIIQKIGLVNVTDVTLINVNTSLVLRLHNLFTHPVRFIHRNFYWPNDTLFNDIYVVQCSNFDHFAIGMDLVKRDPFWNPKAKFIIIIEYIEDFLEDVSSFLEHNNVFDVAVMTYDVEKTEVVVYTFGIERDECDRPVIKILRLLSRCSEVNDTKSIYVTEKKTKLRGCQVKFIAHNYWPFVSFTREGSIEKYLLKLVQQFENITVKLVNYGQREKFGKRLDNFSYTDMLHEIEIYQVEGAAGGYVLTLNRMLNMDFIYPYLVDNYKIITARAKMLSKWPAVLKQLDIRIVLIIFISYCTCCILVTAMDIFQMADKDRGRDFLIVWGYFLGNITHKKNTKTEIPYRLVLLNILLYVIVLSCATQASLLSATTHPIRAYQARSIEEITSNYQMILSPNLLSFMNTNPFVSISNPKVMCRVTLDCMTKVMNKDQEKLYTIASNLYHESYIWKFADEYGNLKIYKISESVGTLLQTMYVRRGSSLAEPFNRLLLRARSAGLIDRFLDKLHVKERLKYKFRPSREKPQSLKGLKGVYLLLMAGYIVSLVCFIFEFLRIKI